MDSSKLVPVPSCVSGEYNGTIVCQNKRSDHVSPTRIDDWYIMTTTGMKCVEEGLSLAIAIRIRIIVEIPILVHIIDVGPVQLSA